MTAALRTMPLRDDAVRGRFVRSSAVREDAARRSRVLQTARRLVVPALALAMAMVLIAALNVVGNWLTAMTRIDVVRVEGSFGPVTRSEIEHSLSTMVAGHSLLNVPMADIARELDDLSWVSAVDVYRVWPHGLIVRVTEKVPVAHWNGDAFISHAGDIFQPENVGMVGALPLLAGPADKAAQVMAFYSAVNAMMLPMGLAVRQLTLNDQLSWEIVTDNGLRLHVDQEEGLTRVRRFLGVYGQRLADVADQVDRVDLRYIGGFAVHWLPPSVVQATAINTTLTGGEDGSNRQQ